MGEYTVATVAFETHVDRGFAVKASYLKEPNQADALVELFKDGQLHRQFFFPAYKIWNIAAHLSDIVDSELGGNEDGYGIAASHGF